ncbi:Kinesin-like protein KIN-7I [Geodia barretti]|uniref:Kinesin-like protein KIN-7I n=1 Tax=Geodia barretti TaxID=519541 RepID=A0AA35SYJ1_GEOBA|nr:Kinesin-like protein KIN-7I [Geodia barretti]
MDSIRVGIRVRPLLDREKGGLKWAIQGENTIVPTTPGNAGFEFDHVFGEASTTDQIYRTITRPIVHSVMQGFNGTVFAYGQTSSGKTFTMMGMEDQPGVIPLAIQEIFEYIEDHDELEFIVRVSYLEIYKEGICDLLDPSFTDLKIREDKDNNVKVHGLKEYVVTNIEEVTRVIFVGNINRTTGETKMNERSSRSHAVLSMAIESRLKDGDSTVKVASLNLVDLAGSERLNATGAAGKRAQEGIAINKSLFTLKQVISKLAEGNSSVHIPYRDSKLTHILKPSLGGNAKTAIICAVTPAELYETELTLNFAICAMKVKNRPMVNEVLGGEEALKKKLLQLEKENGELRNRLSSSESSLTEENRRELTEQIEEKQSRQSELEARIRSLENIIIKSCKPRERETVDQQQGVKYNRRMTICPALLARGMGSPLLIKPNPLSHIKSRHSITPVVTPDVITHRSVSRLRPGAGMGFATPASSEEAWQSVFDSSGFERELQRLEPPAAAAAGEGSSVASLEGETPVPPTVNVRDLERRRTMFRCATFVMDTPSSNISVSTPDQSGTWTEDAEPHPPPAVVRSPLVDAQTQTEEQDEVQEGTDTALTATGETVEPMDTVEAVACADAIIQTEDVATEAVPLTDAVTQTEGGPKDGAVEVSTQTDLKPPQCEEEEEEEGSGGLHLPHHHPPPPPADLDSSTCLCSHRCTLRTNHHEQLQFNQDELMMIQEEAEENMVDAQYTIEQTRLELQAERERSQSLTSQLEKTTSRLKDLEMANSAQEECLTKMCRDSKMASSHHGELEERCSQLETKLVEVEKERAGWREERERWQREREEEKDKLSHEEEEWKEEKERWREEKEEFVRAQEKWRMEEEEWREERGKWEREREGWREEKDKWDRERQGWREERENWVEERQNWTEGWREEREEMARERQAWESEKGLWEVAKTRWETEREEMVAETSVLKEQLQSLQSELEKLPCAKRHCPEPADDAQLTVLMDKLMDMERERERESEQFQISYQLMWCAQQKVRELQKAQETVCYLQEQLDCRPDHTPSLSVCGRTEESRGGDEEK